MGPRRGAVTKAYRIARKVFGKGKPMRTKRGSGRSARRKKPKTTKSRSSKRSGNKTRGDGILGSIVSVSINHKKGVSYEKSEKFDRTIVKGAGTIQSNVGSQAVGWRSYLNGRNTNEGTTLDALYGLYTMLNSDSRKIKGTSLSMQCVSATTSIMEATVYFLRANADTAYDSVGSTNPLNAWQTLDTMLAGTAMDPYIPGETPYVTGFGKYWKIIKKTKLVLNPGQCFRLRMNTREHWMVTPTKTGRGIEANASHYNIRNRTYAWMIVLKGLPCVDSAYRTNVSVAPTKLNYTWEWNCLSSSIAHRSQSTQVLANDKDPMYNSFSGVPTGVNDDDGQMEPIVTA